MYRQGINRDDSIYRDLHTQFSFFFFVSKKMDCFLCLSHREGLPFERLVLKSAQPKIHKFYYSFSWNLKNNIPNSKIAKATIKKDIDIFIFWYVKFWYPMSRLLLATYMLDLDR